MKDFEGKFAADVEELERRLSELEARAERNREAIRELSRDVDRHVLELERKIEGVERDLERKVEDLDRSLGSEIRAAEYRASRH